MGSIGTVGELLEYATRTYTDDVALVDGAGVESTYAELAEAAHGVARAALALGIEPGDRVALWAPNTGRWIHAALGLLSAGAVLVPISTRYAGPESADILRRARCRALFTVSGFLGKDYPRLLADSGVELPDLAISVLVHGESAGAGIGWDDFLARSSEVASETAHAAAGAVGPDSISDILFTSGTTGAPKGAMATHGRTLAVYTA